MYFMVIQAPRKNTTICKNREALMFIIEPRYVDRPLALLAFKQGSQRRH